MMGGLITSLDTPVSKTTGGLLVLPKSHALIQRRMQDERTVLSVAKTVCEQCRLCTDLCPRHLIGHELSRICWFVRLIISRQPRRNCCSRP
jgi:Na+-translocating ferredoxin:NAD+ oxidoreductase RnfC subunit